MERLRLARRPTRMMITRTVNEADVELAAADKNMLVLLEKVERLDDLLEEMIEMDQKVLDGMLDDGCNDEDYDAEVIIINEYKTKVRMARLKLKKCLHPEQSPTPSEGTFLSASENGGRKNRKTYKLPKTEIKKFGGDILDWLSWWAQFEKIHGDEDLHDSDKFQYLVQAMEVKSKAADLVSVFPQTAANYPKAIQALRERFGRDKVLKRVYVRELLKMIISNSREKYSISKTFDKLEGHLLALGSLGITPDQMDVILFPMVESCLPEEILMAWQRSANYGREGRLQNPPKTEFDYMMEFVKQEVDNESQRTMAQSGFGVSANKDSSASHKKKVHDVPTAASLFNGQKEECTFCNKSNHSSLVCYKAKNMSLDEKNRKVRESGRCFKCLRKGHRANDCKATVICKNCEMNHQTVMCPNAEKRNREVQSGDQNITEGVHSLSVTQDDRSFSMSNSSRGKVVLMKTLRVRLQGTNQKLRYVRLLFDEGSQRSYIKTRTAEELNCYVTENLRLQNSLFGGILSKVKSRKGYMVDVSNLNGTGKTKLTLVNEDVICNSCPSIPRGPWMKELAAKKIFVTDTYADSQEVEILIGSDLWGSLMTGKMVKLQCGLVAVESIFGWTLSGVIPNYTSQSFYAGAVISMLTHEEKSVPKLWDLETIGIMDSAEKITQEEHDLQVKESLQENITRDKDGRYVVKLPWVSASISIPNYREVAEKRLIRATEKLKQTGKFQTYDKIFKDWEEEGIVETVPVNENLYKSCFLPHRPVFKEDSLTTPVRPVFDASCKVGRNPSLNQSLEKGPNWLELIPSILLRFRRRRIGVISDIRKAFQMVSVANKDRNYQKFLWWEDENRKIIKVYRHCRVVFGMNCSPFILAAVLDYHLNRIPESDSSVAELLKKSVYVDNCVMSVDTSEEYMAFKEKSTEILSRAKMELRQCECTSTEESKVGPYLGCGLESGRTYIPQELTMVLGLKWDKDLDTLCCKVHIEVESEIVTKRIVLSIVSQVFDPIGFTCPALIHAKKMLQESWAAEIGWDEEWSEELSLSFKNWRKEVPELGKIRIPRNAFGSSRRFQLHMFSDASLEAYAAVVYVRVEEQDAVSVQLLLAKSRLSPLDKKKKKNVTIPRLELLGCLIGSRLLNSIRESMSMENVDSYLWSDSTTAIAWIRRDQDWGTFVGNRVREINKLTKSQKWRHVPGHMNPADLPSRGCSPLELVASKWWEGPEWLKRPKLTWPEGEGISNEDEIYVELKKASTVLLTEVLEVKEPRFSSYQKNVNVAGWVRRFINNCKERKCNRVYEGWLHEQELKVAEKDLIMQIQDHHFRTKPGMKNLQLEKEEDGLWHVKTRLTYKNDTEEFRSPILLPSRDPLVDQLIEFVHRSYCHAGSQFVLGKLREKVWIVHGRKAVNRVIYKCVRCRRHASKSVTCDPSSLPAKRVEPGYAFETTGVDLAGPISLKGGKKCWIVLYTCAVYRGVYLDLVDYLSSEEFLDSLEKFTMTVGRPCTMFSDNGTNFVGANNLMRKLDWKKLQSKFNVNRLQWSFNPPTAAWWGGWWERLVRTIKDLLKKMIGSAKLTRRDLEKCLASISHTINNRPLTTLTEDPEDLTALTPAMFMRDLPVSGLPERELIKSKDLQNAHAKIRVIKKGLQERFRKEYLGLLVHRKNDKITPVPKIGDVVLVGYDNKKRFEWPLGRILELCPGRDGIVRVARVKTVGGVLLRPMQRLYPLEVSTPELAEVAEDMGLSKKASVPIDISPEEIEDDEEIPTVKTRSGRESKKPSRYGQWNS